MDKIKKKKQIFIHCPSTECFLCISRLCPFICIRKSCGQLQRCTNKQCGSRPTDFHGKSIQTSRTQMRFVRTQHFSRLQKYSNAVAIPESIHWPHLWTSYNGIVQGQTSIGRKWNCEGTNTGTDGHLYEITGILWRPEIIRSRETDTATSILSGLKPMKCCAGCKCIDTK